MDKPQFTRFPMRKNETMSVFAPIGYEVQAHSGQVWITQSNKLDDVFLEPGQTYFANEAGTMVIEATMNSFVALTKSATRTTAPEQKQFFFAELKKA